MTGEIRYPTIEDAYDRIECLQQQNKELQTRNAELVEQLKVTLEYWNNLGVRPSWIVPKTEALIGEE